MFEQELKDIWKSAAQAEKIKFDLSRLLIDLNTKMKVLEKAIRKRDRREIAASFIGIPIFGYFAFSIPSIVTKIACVLGILWFCYVIYKLQRVKKNKIPIDLALPFRAQLENQKTNLLQQAKLLDTVLYWYVLPPFIMNIIFIMGLGGPEHFSSLTLAKAFPFSTTKIGTLAGLAVFYTFIVWLNKRAVKKTLRPAIEDIDRVLHQLDSAS